MKLLKQLADHALRLHPRQATSLLESLRESEAVRLLESSSLESASAIVERLSPQFAVAVVSGVNPVRRARFLDTLPVDVATRIARRLPEDRREQTLDALAEKRARSIRSVLRFPEGSAGALMDPDVLALPCELSAREALQRVRRIPELSRYNLYVVDQSQRLVGALNLRELLLARGRSLLENLMVRNPHRVAASADRAAVLSHPGWKEVHSLPVVDEGSAFLGAIRYRTLKQLEDELLSSRGEDMDTGAAFGEVIAVGAKGLLDAVIEPGRRERGASKGS